MDLRKIKSVKVTSEIPGSHFKKYTVAFLPKDHIYNTNFGMTNGVVGTIDPKEASKTVYLSEANYTPVFTFEELQD